MTNITAQMCPFCPLSGIDESEYQTISHDFFGQSASIGGVPSCNDCAAVADLTDTQEVVLAELRMDSLACFFEALAVATLEAALDAAL